MKQVAKLEDSELWKAMYDLARDVFSSFDELPKEEDFQLKFALRSDCFTISSSSASAAGSINPAERLSHLSNVRSALFNMKSLFKTARLRYETKIDPDIMLKIDKLVADIDKEVVEMDQQIHDWNTKIYPAVTKKDLESTKNEV
jgi:hypothetical protein